MKKIDNRQTRQVQRVCGRPYTATARPTCRNKKLSAGIGTKPQKRAIRVA